MANKKINKSQPKSTSTHQKSAPQQKALPKAVTMPSARAKKLG